MLRLFSHKRALIALLYGAMLQAFLFVGWVGVNTVYGGDSRTPSNNKGVPRIQVDMDFVDYGTVPLEEMVQHLTIIKNVGDAPLVIKDCHDGIIHTKALEGC